MPFRSHQRALSATILALLAGFSFAEGREAAPPSTTAQTAPTPVESPARAKQRALFEAHQRLEEKVAAALEESADDARAFGKFLTAAERRRLQAACSSLARNPESSAARELLREFIQGHADHKPRVIARYCFDPSLRQLQQEVRATRRALQERPAESGKNDEIGAFDFRLRRLQREAESEDQRFTDIRGIILAGDGSAKPLP